MAPHHWRELAQLFAVGAATLFTTTVILAVLWVRTRERATRAESLLEGMRVAGGRTDAMHPAIDAMALEIERIGEGQRFLTRVMSEQSGRQGAPANRPPGAITPH